MKLHELASYTEDTLTGLAEIVVEDTAGVIREVDGFKLFIDEDYGMKVILKLKPKKRG